VKTLRDTTPELRQKCLDAVLATLKEAGIDDPRMCALVMFTAKKADGTDDIAHCGAVSDPSVFKAFWNRYRKRQP
jgi:hypothetical protein